jgi:hypothetical protein
MNYLHVAYEPRSTKERLREASDEIGAHMSDTFKAEINTTSED